MSNDLGLSCPRGGDWYVCKDTAFEFVGCCTTNPCADGSGTCPEGRLRPASFSSNKWAKIPAMECDLRNPRPDEPLPLWYTCAAINPPFLGCCYQNPCANGFCPDSNLTAAKLTTEPTARESFLQEANLNSDSGSKSLSGGAIAGIVVGAIAGVALLLAGFWFWRKRKQQQKSVENPPPSADGVSHHNDYKGSPNPYSPDPSAVSPHSGYGYPGTPPQGHGFQNGYYNAPPSELGQQHYVAELSGNHAGEVAMLDSRPIGHHQTHSPTIPPSAVTDKSDFPADKK